MFMRGAVLWECGKPLVVRDDIQIPAVSDSKVLVKLFFSGVCHSQIMEARGYRGEDRYVPHLLGHEGTGVVLEVGKNITRFRPGEKVILTWLKAGGIESGGTCYCCGGININSGAVTTFNEYALVSENRLVHLPDGVPLDIGSLFGCALPTGAGLIFNEVKPKTKSKILIVGLGGVGLSALMAANLFDPTMLIAIDINERKLNLAKEFGASHIFNGNDRNLMDRLKDLTHGEGVDYSIEAAGITETIELAFGLVKKFGGLCVFASHPKSGTRLKLDPFDLISGKQIRGSWGGASNIENDVLKLSKLYLSGKLPLERLITNRYRLEDINQALLDLETGLVERPLIDFGEGSFS